MKHKNRGNELNRYKWWVFFPIAKRDVDECETRLLPKKNYLDAHKHLLEHQPLDFTLTFSSIRLPLSLNFSKLNTESDIEWILALLWLLA